MALSKRLQEMQKQYGRDAQHRRTDKKNRSPEDKLPAFPNIDANEFELAELHHHNSNHSPQVKVQALMAYLTTGSETDAAASIGVSRDVMHEFRQSVWWAKAMPIARKSLQKELDNDYTLIVHKTISELTDRVLKGNKHTGKDGKVKRTPLSAKELLEINTKIFEKRALLRGEPTTHTQKTDVKITVSALAKELEAYSKQQNTMPVPTEEAEIEDE